MGGKRDNVRSHRVTYIFGAIFAGISVFLSGFYLSLTSEEILSSSSLTGEIILFGAEINDENSLVIEGKNLERFEELNLPDLQTLVPTELQVEIEEETERKLLRFTNSIVNTGEGKLELRGKVDRQSGDLTVWQYIYGSEETAIEELDGTYEYELGHKHYHWENFAVYEIWSAGKLGGLGSLLVSEEKVGYCIFDTVPVGKDWLEEHGVPDLEISPEDEYTNCGVNLQGISVGWVDLYEYDLEGQALDISGFEDGVYALRAITDPDGVLFETNPRNNSVVLYFLLQDEDVYVLGENYTILDVFAVRPMW